MRRSVAPLARGAGWLVGLLVGLWVRTLRVRFCEAPSARAKSPGARVLAFFHGQQMALLAAARRPTAVLVSRSRDGELQSRVMRHNGLFVLRGSTSRGGAGGLRALVRALRTGYDAAVAVDGPRGPRHQAKPGAAYAAAETAARLLPVATASARAITLRKSWDCFEIPLPFSVVSVVVGEPVDAREALGDPAVLSDAVASARQRAERLLGSEAGDWTSEGGVTAVG